MAMDSGKKDKGATDLVMDGVVESYRWVRDYATAVKNGQYIPYSPIERKAREATRNEPWGPTGTMLNELAEASFTEEDCYLIFTIIDLRLGYPPDKWRNVYKALTVLEFILKRGSKTWVTLAVREMVPKLEGLETFEFRDEKGHDQGINVRHKSAAIRALLQSPRLLRAEREAAQKKRREYKGFSRDDLASGGQASADGGFPSRNSWSQSQSRSHSGPFEAGYGHFEVGKESQVNEPKPEGSPGSSRGGAESRMSRQRSTPAGRNAGEMKGVTLEDNKKNLAALKAILARPENRECADCSGASRSRPTWASINTGVFICMQCAGIHRGLGVHISKVRSCTLDTWLPEQVAFMSATGNAVANSYWEALLPAGARPTSGDRNELTKFISMKYAKEWADGTWPPAPAVAASLPTQASLAPPARTQHPEASPAPTAGGGSFWTAFDDPPPAAATSTSSQAPPHASQGGSFWGVLEDSPDLTAQPPPSDAAKRAQEEPHSGGRFWSAFDTPASLEPQAAPPAFPEAQAGGSSWEAFEEGPTRVPRPADPYGPQLVQLSEMGFKDTRQCMAALQKAGGDISVAAELLIGKPPQQQPPAAAAGSLASAGPSPREEPVRAVFTASQPPPSRVLSPSVQAPPPFMTDLISLDDEPRPPPFCPQQSAAPVDVSAFASSFDLIGFGSDTQPSGSFQAPHPPPLSSSLLPPPTVPLYFESAPQVPVVETSIPDILSGIKEIVNNPNIMDSMDFFPAPAMHSHAESGGISEAFTGHEFPAAQHTGRESVVHGLDDLLSYQYTGADVRNTRLDGPSSDGRMGLANHAPPLQQQQQHLGAPMGRWTQSALGPPHSQQRMSGSLAPVDHMARAGLPSGGRSAWSSLGQQGGLSSVVGVTAFNSLEQEVLSTYNMPPSSKSRQGPGNQPMRT